MEESPRTAPLAASEPPAASARAVAAETVAPSGRAGRWLALLRDRDHTRGALVVSLVVLSLPAILQSLAGAGAYQIVDLYFLGQLGPVPTAAVGMTNQALRQVPFLLLLGGCIGAQMTVARCVGAGRGEAADHAAGQALLLGAALGALTATGALVPRPLLALVTSDPDAIATAVPYLRLTFGLMFGHVFVMLFSFILTGAGESTTPLLITLVSTPVAIFAEYCLIFGNFGAPALGVSGVAVGLACGTAVSLTLAIWALRSGRCRVHLRRRHLAPDPQVLRQLLGVMWQPALHMLARTVMLIYFMALAGHLGTKVQAAYTIGLRIELTLNMLAFPIANACATLVGQNLAAGSRRRAWRSIRVAYALEFSVLGSCAAFLLVFRHAIVDAFTRDPAVAAIAAEYLMFSAAAMCLHAFYFVSFRALQGAGDMNSPMLISLTSALFLGAPLAYTLATRTDLGPTGMWIAGLVYSLTNTALTVGWLAYGRWARAGRGQPPLPQRSAG
ncbi:MAG: MATE family efflux transporter [Deltaproteobacteria bacterium]|nr:MAG: MATE family efflux transporter [Deltaproteobacteria bacterium]